MDFATIEKWLGATGTEKGHHKCDKPYHKIKANMPHGEELKKMWNYP